MHEKIEKATELIARGRHDYQRVIDRCDELLTNAVNMDANNLFDAQNFQDTYTNPPWVIRDIEPLEQP